MFHAFNAIKKANFNYIKNLILDERLDVNETNIYGETILHLICEEKNQLELVKLLVEKGAIVNKEDGCGLTPLHKAVQLECFDIITYLLSVKVDVDKQSTNGFRALHYAVNHNRYDITKLLVDHGADVNVQASTKETPIFIAAQKGYTAIAKLLLEKNAYFKSCTSNGWSPVTIACKYGNVGILELFIEFGLDINERHDGDTPLFVSVSYGQENIVHLLIEKKVKTGDEDAGFEFPLLIACDKGYFGIAKRLIKYGADINKCFDNLSPLHAATNKRNEGIVKLLLENGAKVDTENTDGDIPLHGAVTNGDYGITKMLINYSSDVNKLCRLVDDNRPIHMAIKAKSYKITKLLIKKGADVNIENEQGKTPVYIATEMSYIEILGLLIEKGACVNTPDCVELQSPLHVAASLNNERMVRMLIDAGASVNYRCEDQECLPRELTENKNIIDILKKNEALWTTNSHYAFPRKRKLEINTVFKLHATKKQCQFNRVPKDILFDIFKSLCSTQDEIVVSQREEEE